MAEAPAGILTPPIISLYLEPVVILRQYEYALNDEDNSHQRVEYSGVHHHQDTESIQ